MVKKNGMVNGFMKDLNENDLQTIKNYLDSIDKFQSMLAKDCVHVLRGIDPAKISIKKFDEAVSVAKRASDEIEKDVKHLKKFFK